jgi:hypothetical protein
MFVHVCPVLKLSGAPWLLSTPAVIISSAPILLMGSLRWGQVRFLSKGTDTRTWAHCVLWQGLGYMLDDKESWYYSRQWQEIFLFPKTARPAVSPPFPQTSYSMATVGALHERNAAGTWSWPPPSCAEVKWMKLYLSTPPNEWRTKLHLYLNMFLIFLPVITIICPVNCSARFCSIILLCWQ